MLNNNPVAVTRHWISSRKVFQINHFNCTPIQEKLLYHESWISDVREPTYSFFFVWIIDAPILSKDTTDVFTERLDKIVLVAMRSMNPFCLKFAKIISYRIELKM